MSTLLAWPVMFRYADTGTEGLYRDGTTTADGMTWSASSGLRLGSEDVGDLIRQSTTYLSTTYSQDQRAHVEPVEVRSVEPSPPNPVYAIEGTQPYATGHVLVEQPTPSLELTQLTHYEIPPAVRPSEMATQLPYAVPMNLGYVQTQSPVFPHGMDGSYQYKTDSADIPYKYETVKGLSLTGDERQMVIIPHTHTTSQSQSPLLVSMADLSMMTSPLSAATVPYPFPDGMTLALPEQPYLSTAVSQGLLYQTVDATVAPVVAVQNPIQLSPVTDANVFTFAVDTMTYPERLRRHSIASGREYGQVLGYGYDQGTKQMSSGARAQSSEFRPMPCGTALAAEDSFVGTPRDFSTAVNFGSDTVNNAQLHSSVLGSSSCQYPGIPVSLPSHTCTTSSPMYDMAPGQYDPSVGVDMERALSDLEYGGGTSPQTATSLESSSPMEPMPTTAQRRRMSDPTSSRSRTISSSSFNGARRKSAATLRVTASTSSSSRAHHHDTTTAAAIAAAAGAISSAETLDTMATHGDQPQTHACQQCFKSFHRRQNLLSHMRCHSEERPFHCSDCPHSFRRKHDLHRHFRSMHALKKPFECGHCGKPFARSDALTRHLSTRCAKKGCDEEKEKRREMDEVVGQLQAQDLGGGEGQPMESMLVDVEMDGQSGRRTPTSLQGFSVLSDGRDEDVLVKNEATPVGVGL